jgi:hypothetical protein
MPATTSASSTGRAIAIRTGRGGRRTSGGEVHHRAGQRAGDAADTLHLRDDELAELVDVGRPRRAR